jgi:spore maturation protein CgeB
LRILIPSPHFDDSFVDNVRVTLEAMGHEVKTLGHITHAVSWSYARRAFFQLRAALRGDSPGPRDRAALAAAKAFSPDLLLGLTVNLHPETLAEIGKLCPGRRVLWWGDAPANSSKWGILDPSWDAVFTKDRTAAVKLRLVGRNAHLLHEAMNPIWHKPLASQANGRVCVAGNSYAFRQAVIARLLETGADVDLFGPPPPSWSDPRVRKCHRGRYIVREEKSRVFGEALACLNTFALAEGDSLNCRAFEIAGAGGLQLIEYRPAIEECFEPGKELLSFSSFEELLSHLDRAQRFPSEMGAIREAGMRRALSEHTYQHRLRTVLDHLEGKCP